MGDHGMLKWSGCAFLIVAQLSAGCAGQGQVGGGTGTYQPPVAPPAPMPTYAPPPAYSPAPTAYAPPAYTTQPLQPYIYPQRGQSPQQEESDRGQCYGWAVQQTGFDPANPRVAMPPPPPMYSPPPQQSLAGGALAFGAGGAALGAAGGAIGGNAGEGAAIGAAVGGLFGLIRRAREHEEQQQQMQQGERQQQAYQAQQQNALAQGRANYNRAFSACMTGRGYTVN